MIEEQWQKLQDAKRFMADARARGANDVLDQKLTVSAECRKLGKMLRRAGFDTYLEWKEAQCTGDIGPSGPECNKCSRWKDDCSGKGEFNMEAKKCI